MNNNLQDSLFKPSERMRDLQFLEEIEQNPKVSQREISNKFGIALGVTNACIKRMARRGLIRLKGFPPRRIAYYLTPKGFAEKSRLTLHFLSYNIQHYAEMKKLISKKFLEMQADGVKRVLFYGIGDEMEVAYITLQGVNLNLVGIADGDEKNWGKILFGHRVGGLKDLRTQKADAILITSTKGRDLLAKNLMKERGWNSVKIFTI
jgi:DNA-binding MarR family transcriptional regulator